ncbi:MAG: glycosyl transferase [Blastocatellia bacterium]|nr:MAG: glycosyl transferase [Blastocatellia bacterium]
MSTNEELTIVIPAKNEERLIGTLLDSICKQDYERIRSTTIYLANANSTDRTVERALSYADTLHIRIIQGGLPAQGRNAGARMANSKYILFLDADVELGDRGLIRRGVELMKRRQLDCATTFILSEDTNVLNNLMYLGNCIIQIGSKYSRPFSPGAFMLFERQRFNELGGFNVSVLYAEDFFLTKNVNTKRFGIVPGFIRTTNRRFKQMGHLKFIRLFFRAVANSGNDAFFFEDHQYWAEQDS